MSEGQVTSDSLRAPPQAAVPEPEPARRRGLGQRIVRITLLPTIAILLALIVGALIMVASSPLVRGSIDPSLEWLNPFGMTTTSVSL